jgi:hypothetical protein
MGGTGLWYLASTLMGSPIIPGSLHVLSSEPGTAEPLNKGHFEDNTNSAAFVYRLPFMEV